MKTEWVIHVWGKKRDTLELTENEEFHMGMIRKFDLSRFDRILVNIAMDDIDDDALFGFLSEKIKDIFADVKEVDILKCQNDSILCEAVTFKPYILDRIGEDVRVLYTHFKGYKSNVDLVNSNMYPARNILINERYWSYIMYRMNLDEKYFDEMSDAFEKDKDVYCWCLIDKVNTLRRDGIGHNYYIEYFDAVKEVLPGIENYFDDTMLNTHSPGSFVWYNLKALGIHLKDKLNYVKDFDFNKIKEVGCAPHLCELYIWQFLNRDNVQEQTFINNINGQISSIEGQFYTKLFCSKTVCREYLTDFEKYIIKTKII